MCGSGSAVSNVPAKWLGGRYQLYPIEGGLKGLAHRSDNLGLATIRAAFPDEMEAYCVLALLAAEEESEEWAGATYAYLDRMAVSWLRREYGKYAWKRLGLWIFNFGQSEGLRGIDIFALLTSSFRSFFWRSMRRMVEKGDVRIEQREVEDDEWVEGKVNVDVFFPTAQLVNKINSAPGVRS